MPPSERACAWCGEPFVPAWNPLQRHCSLGCAGRSFSIRRGWTPERVQLLEQLLARNMPLRLIAAELRMTKNAVIGKAHRLGLTKRRKPPAPKPAPVEFPGDGWCVYPHGNPGDPGFHFCGAPVKPGSSYCGPHHKLCYTRLALPEAA